tara:strand:+ start:3782 stop:5077 length:1296 start_codon:yes stop_codon:yes gene_type:complete
MNILFIGLGRIGLPISLVASSQNHKVYAYDNDKTIINNLKNSITHFHEKNMDKLLKKNIDKNFFPTNDIIHLKKKKIDIIFFTIGTSIPSFPKDFKLNNFFKIINNIIDVFGKNPVYCLRTTIPVGTTDKLVKKYNNKLKIAYVGERIMEGNAIMEEKTLPKIIGTYEDQTYKILKSYFNSIGGKIIRTSNTKTAEFCKLVDNSYRSTIFAFANDIALCAENNGIDVYEVIQNVNYNYKRNNVSKPGFVSGYCLGKDPYIFEYAYYKKNNKLNSTWYNARKSNDFLYDYIINIIKKNKYKRLTFLGLSFKEDIDDFRMSHSIEIINKLLKKNNKLYFSLFDPNININKYTDIKRFIDKSQNTLSTNNIYDERLYNNSDCIIITHKHNEIKNMNKRKIKQLIINNNIHIHDFWNVWGHLFRKYNNYFCFGRR